MNFELHPSLAKKIFIKDLSLCRVLLQDEEHYPWILLVPRRVGVSRIMDLKLADQHQLLIELDLAQKVLWENFHPTQLNVAALGNKTPQLHVHVIARYNHDPAWPGAVWDHPVKSPYPEEKKRSIIKLLAEVFAKLACE